VDGWTVATRRSILAIPTFGAVPTIPAGLRVGEITGTNASQHPIDSADSIHPGRTNPAQIFTGEGPVVA
jgi:hypothetical protein